MKKILSLLLSASMCIGGIAVPVQASDSVSATVLEEENFETVADFSDWIALGAEASNEESVIADTDTANTYDFGLDNKKMVFKSNVGQGYYMPFAEPTENIRRGKGTAPNGYSVDISFDFVPGSSISQVKLITTTAAGDWDLSNQATAVAFEDEYIHLYGRKANTKTDAINIAELLGSYVTDSNHAFRVRIIYNRKDNDGNDICAYDVYVDGVKVFENVANEDAQKQALIAGIGIVTDNINEFSTNRTLGILDNIKVAEYDSTLTIPYTEPQLKNDALVSVIRRSGAYLNNDELETEIKDNLQSAVNEAKDAYSDETADKETAANAVLEAVIAAEESLKHGEPVPTESPTEAPTENPTVTPKPDVDVFSYFVNNDYENESKAPFSEADITIVEDDTAFIGKAWKISGATSLISDVFEGVNIIDGSYSERTDSITEFDIKFHNFNAANTALVLTQRYDQTLDGTPIANITFRNGVIKSTETGGKTENTLGNGVFEDDKWYRVKIVQHAVGENGDYPLDMSMYIDGTALAKNFARQSTTKAKTRYYNQILLSGLADGSAVYIDNLKIYKTSASDAVIPVDLGRLLKVVREMQGFLDTAVVGDDLGEYDAEDYASIKTAYDMAVSEIPLIKTQAAADAKTSELETLYGRVKPNQGVIAVESISYSAQDLTTENMIDTSITVNTSRLAEDENEILVLSVLYKNSDDYNGGEVLKIASDIDVVGKKDSKTLNTSLDLSEYSADEKSGFYIRTYVLTGSDKTTVIPAQNDTLGSKDENSGTADNIYGQKADIFKKEFSNGTNYFSLSTVTEANDEVTVVVTKANTTLGQINENSSDLIYYNVIEANSKGESVVSFKPETAGTYHISVYSKSAGRIFDKDCIYENSAALSETLVALKNTTKKIREVKQIMDMDIELFEKSDDAGIDLDSITEYVFDSNSGADVYAFKTEYLKIMYLLYTIKTASNLDSVTSVLNENNMQTTSNTYNWNKICEYVYSNKAKVTNIEDLEELLEYKPNSASSSGGGGGGGGFTGSTGAGGNGMTTAQADLFKEKKTTPYEENVKTFTDISNVSWAKEAILFMEKNNIIDGKEIGIFAPNDSITREEFAKIIVNMFKVEAKIKALPFMDVAEAAWYYPFVQAAFSNGIVNGISDTTFGVGMNISREDASVMLYRAGETVGAVYSDKAEFIPFEDACSDYATEAVENLAKAGIVTGTGNNMLSPKKTLTRAEAATMVYRLYCYINEVSNQ